jgi:autotransporter-associated beta strand protein
LGETKRQQHHRAVCGIPGDTYTPGTHTDVTTDFAFGGVTTTNTLAFRTSAGIDLGLDGQTLVLNQGGVLVSDDVLNPTVISNGTLTGAAAVGSEVIVHQNSARAMTISAVVADNGTNTTTLTKAGVEDSTLILTGANTYTGGTHVNQGFLQVGSGGTTGALGQGIVVNDATLVFNRSDDVTVLNPIGGYGTVLKNGAGILNLRGTNAFSGGLVVSQGTVATDGPQSLGTSTITLGNAGTGASNVALLSDLGADISNNIVVSTAGTGTATIGSSSSGVGVADPAIFSGAITLDRATLFQASNTDRTTFTGVISGAGNLSFTTGRTTLENNNTFTGTVSVENGATLQVGTGSFANIRNQIPDAAAVTLNGNGAFRLNGDSEIIAQLNSTSNTSTVQAIAGGPTVLTLANGGSFAGAFDGGLGGGLTIENTGGTLTLSGTGDNPTGRILVNGGTVVLAKTSNAGVHAAAVDVTVNNGLLQLGGTGGDQIWDGSATNRTQMIVNGGTFDLNGQSEGFSVLDGFGGVVTNNSATAATLTLGTNNWSNTGYYGTIRDGTGALALTKTGAGGLILTGTNTYHRRDDD